MAVALIALITIGCLVYFQSANNSAKSSELISDLAALASVINYNYSQQGDYAGISTAVVLNFSAFPERLRVVGGGGMRHPWDNTVTGITVSPASVQGPNDGYTISLHNIPAEICIDLTSKLYTKFTKVVVNSQTITSVATSTIYCGTSGSVQIDATRSNIL
ncbi:type 4 pilus major pilin [Pseudomonas aeruginosa]